VAGGGGGPAKGSIEEAQAKNSLPDGWNFSGSNGEHFTANDGDGGTAVFQNGQWVNTGTGAFMTSPALDPTGRNPMSSHPL
jgi:hypothetical protein